MTRAMKDSGIEWIGQIPENWEVSKLKSNFSFEKGKNAAQYTQEYIGENEGCYPVYSGQTENNGIMGKINSFDYDIKECVFSTTVGAKVMTPRYLRGKFSLSQNCLIMLPMSKYVCKLLYYVLLPLFSYEKALIPSHMQPSLRFSDLKKYFLPLPPLSEQQKIADYLDKRCEKIDTAIDNQKQIIEKLKEYKQSLITETVTKGLNPNVKLKDSGIEWIGSIPEHWKVRKLKTLGKVKIGLTYKPEDISDTGILVLRSSNIQNGKVVYGKDDVYVKKDINADLILQKSDILICTRNGSANLVGKNALITETFEGKTCGAFMSVFRGEYNNYIYYVLQSNIFSYYLATFFSSTVNQLTSGNLNNISITFPVDKNEMLNIVNYLDKKCNQIDEAIKQKEETISKLEEYKKSLIFECVTGKKEVA